MSLKVSQSPIGAPIGSPPVNHLDDAIGFLQGSGDFLRVALFEPAGEQNLSVERDGLQIVVGDALASSAKRGVALALSASALMLACVAAVAALFDSNAHKR